ASTALALQEVLETVPKIEDLAIGVGRNARGFFRTLAPLQPDVLLGDVLSPPSPGAALLASAASRFQALQRLRFDFLSDDALRGLMELADGSLRLRSASFSGVERELQDADNALATLLAKLGEGLEEFTLRVDVETERRPFLLGQLHGRLGALPSLWRGRE
ncbi:unnamed protein product, partial [Polarella glacialis]